LKCRSGGLLVARLCSAGHQPYPLLALRRKMASAAYGSVSGETPMLRRYEDGPDDQSRPAIVFVHGWPDDHRLWDKQVSTFALKHDRDRPFNNSGPVAFARGRISPAALPLRPEVGVIQCGGSLSLLVYPRFGSLSLYHGRCGLPASSPAFPPFEEDWMK